MSRKTSELGYYVRGEAKALGGNLPLDAGAVRHGLAGNLNHLQDEAAQTWANHYAPVSSAVGIPFFRQTTTTPGVISRIDNLPPIPVFLTKQSDGSSSRVVVTLRCYISAAGTATFRVVLGRLHVSDGIHPPVGSAIPLPGVYPDIVSTDTASTTVVTIRSTLYVPSLIPTYLVNLGDLARGVPVPATYAPLAAVYMGQVEVWATSTDAAAHPRVEGITVRGWVG